MLENIKMQEIMEIKNRILNLDKSLPKSNYQSHSINTNQLHQNNENDSNNLFLFKSNYYKNDFSNNNILTYGI